MKESYIKQVKKHLHLPRNRKREILCDLHEMFASALENGETEQQVIERLGDPKEFAENVAEQWDGHRISARKHRTILFRAATLAIAVLCFLMYGIIQAKTVPSNVIGQADSMTGIQVEGALGISPPSILLLLGTAALIAAAIPTARLIIKKRRQS